MKIRTRSTRRAAAVMAVALLATACGGVLAALMAGNAVVLVPPPEVVLVAWRLAEILWEAGVPEELLQEKSKPFKRIVVFEMNLGQYVDEIRRVLGEKKVEFFGQMNGVLITPAQITEVIGNE